jgi:hypothetical protein
LYNELLTFIIIIIIIFLSFKKIIIVNIIDFSHVYILCIAISDIDFFLKFHIDIVLVSGLHRLKELSIGRKVQAPCDMLKCFYIIFFVGLRLCQILK